MKKSVIVSVVALLSVSFLLGGCGKSPKEEYADLCKKYEPYNAFKIQHKIYKNVDNSVLDTEKGHSFLDKHKNYILEGEKIFKEMEKLASSDKDVMNHFQKNYIHTNNTPNQAKKRFNNICIKEHKQFHKGCTYDFKF